MARCSYHPNVETEMRCAECGKPICPKEMVPTPVGYKCPEDARPKRSQYVLVKPRQLLMALLFGAAAGIGGGIVFALVRIGGGILLGLLWGFLVAEAVRRGSGGHRGATVATVAALCVVLGWAVAFIFGGMSPATAVLAAVVAAASSQR